jgi:hypothetical protein
MHSELEEFEDIKGVIKMQYWVHKQTKTTINKQTKTQYN